MKLGIVDHNMAMLDDFPPRSAGASLKLYWPGASLPSGE